MQKAEWGAFVIHSKPLVWSYVIKIIKAEKLCHLNRSFSHLDPIVSGNPHFQWLTHSVWAASLYSLHWQTFPTQSIDWTHTHCALWSPEAVGNSTAASRDRGQENSRLVCLHFPVLRATAGLYCHFWTASDINTLSIDPLPQKRCTVNSAVKLQSSDIWRSGHGAREEKALSCDTRRREIL